MTSSLNSPPDLETSQAAVRLWVFGPHLGTWATAGPMQIRTYRAVQATARRPASDGPESAIRNSAAQPFRSRSATAADPRPVRTLPPFVRRGNRDLAGASVGAA